MNNISPNQAQTLLQFLARSQISGAEAPAFMECVMALRLIASPAPAASVEADTAAPIVIDQKG